jgi:hypothetical protein
MENSLTVQNENSLFMEEDTSFIADLTQPATKTYSSFEPKTAEDKKAFFNAINATEKRIGDLIGETITVKNVYVEVVHCINPETGEASTCPRVVLLDDKNVGYQCVSKGVFSSLSKMFQVFGVPATWDKPIKIKVKQITKGQKKILTLAIA